MASLCFHLETRNRHHRHKANLLRFVAQPVVIGCMVFYRFADCLLLLCYVDGALLYTIATASTTDEDFSATFALYAGSSQFFVGDIDEFILTRNWLSDTHIKTLCDYNILPGVASSVRFDFEYPVTSYTASLFNVATFDSYDAHAIAWNNVSPNCLKNSKVVGRPKVTPYSSAFTLRNTGFSMCMWTKSQSVSAAATIVSIGEDDSNVPPTCSSFAQVQITSIVDEAGWAYVSPLSDATDGNPATAWNPMSPQYVPVHFLLALQFNPSIKIHRFRYRQAGDTVHDSPLVELFTDQARTNSVGSFIPFVGTSGETEFMLASAVTGGFLYVSITPPPSGYQIYLYEIGLDRCTIAPFQFGYGKSELHSQAHVLQ